MPKLIGKFLIKGLTETNDYLQQRMKGVSNLRLDELLRSLEAKGLAILYSDKHGNISLVKATYKGLRQAKSLDFYKWIPKWMKAEHLF